MEKKKFTKKKRKADNNLTPEEKKEQDEKKNAEGWNNLFNPEDIKNPKFEYYYKNQLACFFTEPSSFETFLEKLKEKLPCVFRVNKAHSFAKQFLSILLSPDLIPKLLNATNEEVPLKIIPKTLTNYPEWKDLVYNINIPRMELKKSENLANFHKFIQKSVDSGLISRQEAVSMIPPMLLRIVPGDRVFDMCAAPGSKTAQFLESFYENFDYFNKEDYLKDSGCVLANDNNQKRAYTMVHQLKRLNTAGMIVISHDAQSYPFLYSDEDQEQRVLFDKILADVPCSSDAVMRKLPHKWKNWGTKDSYSLHKIQLQIIKRGLNLLKVGGKLVYSTCSLNPIENEAIIAEAFRCFGKDGEIEIVNVEDAFLNSDIKPHNGLKKWNVFIEDKRDKAKLVEIKSINDNAYSFYKDTIEPSCFPPSPEEADKFQLNNCVRLLPHDSDTSGFFITLIKKNKPLSASEIKSKPKRELAPVKKDYSLFQDKYPNELKWIKDYYGLDDNFPFNQLLTMSNAEKAKKITFISKGVYDYLNFDKRGQLKFENAGVKIFERNKMKPDGDGDDYCLYRICQDGLMYALPFMHNRTAITTTETFKQILSKPETLLEELKDKNLVEKIKTFSTGTSVIINVKDVNQPLNKDNFLDAICSYTSKKRIALMINVEHMHVFQLKYELEEKK